MMQKLILAGAAMVFGAVLSFLTAIPGAVVLMFILGWVHEKVLTSVLPAGFLDCYILAFLLAVLVSILSPTSSD
jgi:hypothetical protein